MSIYEIEKWEKHGLERYSRHPKGRQYLLTPVDIKKSLTYLDYIGYGGFKIVVNKFQASKDIEPPIEMKPILDELDLVTKIIEYQNKIERHNNACNNLSKCSGLKHYKDLVVDKWNFYDFKNEYINVPI